MDRLTQTVDRLREEIDMFETQCAAQMEETKAAQKALSEAITEIEVSKNYTKKTHALVNKILTIWKISLLVASFTSESHHCHQYSH